MQIQFLSKSEIAIKCVSKLMTPIVNWLIKSGVGYKDFSPILKKIFFEQALIEAQNTKSKTTDSSLSLLAGLNRRDISSFKETPMTMNELHTISVSSRVVTLWVQKKWAKKIKFSNADISFETLAKEVSQDTHPKTVLLDLERLGLITIEDDEVILNAESFTPSQNSTKCQILLAKSASDHLNAGLINTFTAPNSFLEQSINADELSPESVEALKKMSTELWKNLSIQLLDKAIELAEQDKHKENANNRFTFGVYEYHEKGSIK